MYFLSWTEAYLQNVPATVGPEFEEQNEFANSPCNVQSVYRQFEHYIQL